MTYLAQHTHSLPSKLEIEEGCIRSLQRQGTRGTMEDLSLQRLGGYGDVMGATMLDSRSGEWVTVAVKSIGGNFGEEEQIVCFTRTC